MNLIIRLLHVKWVLEKMALNWFAKINALIFRNSTEKRLRLTASQFWKWFKARHTVDFFVNVNTSYSKLLQTWKFLVKIVINCRWGGGGGGDSQT